MFSSIYSWLTSRFVHVFDSSDTYLAAVETRAMGRFHGKILKNMLITAIFSLEFWCQYSWIFKWWGDYFDLSYDNETLSGEKALKSGHI